MILKDEAKTSANGKKTKFWIAPASDSKGLPPLPGWMKHALSLIAFCVIGACLFLGANSISDDKSASLLLARPFQKPWKDRDAKDTNQREDETSKTEKKPQKRISKINNSQVAKTESTIHTPASPPFKSNINEQISTHRDVIKHTPLNPLELIRKDPKRIYLDKKLILDDLTFTIRNVSENGIEIHVSNAEDSDKTYYFPNVTAEGTTSHFLGNVLSPGSGAFGWVMIPNLRKRKSLNIELTAVGAGKKSETIELEW